MFPVMTGSALAMLMRVVRTQHRATKIILAKARKIIWTPEKFAPI
jgi:hypothetical protein